jgi:hypothetical protein
VIGSPYSVFMVLHRAWDDGLCAAGSVSADVCPQADGGMVCDVTDQAGDTIVLVAEPGTPVLPMLVSIGFCGVKFTERFVLGNDDEPEPEVVSA